ncbi:MAG TPA: serine acetyltransferase [Candidatus Pullichristensenella excrementigallinarum]|uniref:Serine acetyltransferase n=1 Tax=Candidatus Pullichristensenella excrementigallinarum TaxID=2840907 RepID=A0A9D1IAK6_9FIRM|nr:serine acetyltransferase [Candidatus Pullichristensenella excrementigallinarum]
MSDLREWMNREARNTAKALSRINLGEMAEQSAGGFGLRARAVEFLDTIKAAMFPSLYESGAVSEKHLISLAEGKLFQASEQLLGIARDVFLGRCAPVEREKCDRVKCRHRADTLAMEFMQQVAPIRELLSEDLRAAYEGDPAARYLEEILLSYPSIEAVSTYRIAHALFVLGLPVVPRILTEHAHARTGIDIHPSATIGRHFFIDHGTGVVIGETCVIGDNVKLYQGVTLGAKSFPLDANGNPVKGIKRHPNLEDDVIVYANATILGGDVTIGRGSVIGGNTWITHSVPAGSRILKNGEGA